MGKLATYPLVRITSDGVRANEFSNKSSRNSYDGFGRVLTETRADGSKTASVQLICVSSSVSCPTLASYFVASASTGGTVSYVFYDVLGREIQRTKQGYNGQTVVVDTTYNAIGKVASKSKPHYAWP